LEGVCVYDVTGGENIATCYGGSLLPPLHQPLTGTGSAVVTADATAIVEWRGLACKQTVDNLCPGLIFSRQGAMEVRKLSLGRTVLRCNVIVSSSMLCLLDEKLVGGFCRRMHSICLPAVQGLRWDVSRYGRSIDPCTRNEP
jgi:hypothetical protein